MAIGEKRFRGGMLRNAALCVRGAGGACARVREVQSVMSTFCGVRENEKRAARAKRQTEVVRVLPT